MSDALTYRGLLGNTSPRDPTEGVNHFNNTQKKYFLKGATHVYLYRLPSCFYHGRRNTDFLIFNSKLGILP